FRRQTVPVHINAKSLRRGFGPSRPATTNTSSPASRISTRLSISASPMNRRVSMRFYPAMCTWLPRRISARQIESAPGLSLFQTKAGAYNDLVDRLDTMPTGDPNFVLALKYLFDREQIRRTIYPGYAVIANDQPIDPTNRFYYSGLAQRPFDP